MDIVVHIVVPRQPGVGIGEYFDVGLALSVYSVCVARLRTLRVKLY